MLSNIVKTRMKEQFALGDSIEQIAEAFGVKLATVQKVCSNAVSNKGSISVTSENKQQSYRENLQWAMNAAGEYLRSKKRPTSCPNNSSYFLYTQALEEPKDFMAKVGQIESKSDGGDDDRESKKSSRKTLVEIESFLEELKSENSNQRDG